MLLYVKEHTSCFNYNRKGESALEVFNYENGDFIEKDSFDNSIVFITSGSCRVSSGTFLNTEIADKKILLFPPGAHFQIEFMEKSTIIICHATELVRLCECTPIEKLLPEKSSGHFSPEFNMLDINGQIEGFLNEFIKHTNNGLKCIYYSELKNKELFYLLRAYYKKEDLARFFQPLLSNDARFTQFIYKNYRKVNSVQELTELSFYSVSGFKKQFTKVFGVSASEWMREQKAKNIYHELNCSSLTIKELCHKYEFASVSSFNAFCKQHFGLPPGEIRKQLMVEQ